LAGKYFLFFPYSFLFYSAINILFVTNIAGTCHDIVLYALYNFCFEIDPYLMFFMTLA